MHGSGDLHPARSDLRRRLIRHAREHFVSVGYAATRMESIARHAGASSGTRYVLFSRKAALFNAVIDGAAEDCARQTAVVPASEGAARPTRASFAGADGAVIA